MGTIKRVGPAEGDATTWKECQGCHVGAQALAKERGIDPDADPTLYQWRQALRSEQPEVLWGGQPPTKICEAIKGAFPQGQRLVRHVKEDLLITLGFQGEAGGARMIRQADEPKLPDSEPPPMSQTQFAGLLEAWVTALNAKDRWPAEPSCGCPTGTEQTAAAAAPVPPPPPPAASLPPAPTAKECWKRGPRDFASAAQVPDVFSFNVTDTSFAITDTGAAFKGRTASREKADTRKTGNFILALPDRICAGDQGSFSIRQNGQFTFYPFPTFGGADRFPTATLLLNQGVSGPKWDPSADQTVRPSTSNSWQITPPVRGGAFRVGLLLSGQFGAYSAAFVWSYSPE